MSRITLKNIIDFRNLEMTGCKYVFRVIIKIILSITFFPKFHGKRDAMLKISF